MQAHGVKLFFYRFNSATLSQVTTTEHWLTVARSLTLPVTVASHSRYVPTVFLLEFPQPTRRTFFCSSPWGKAR